MIGTRHLFLFLSILAATLASADGEQQFAAIGDLKLESGAVLRDCKVGYRTYGTLDAKKDNAVLVPSWFMGTSGNYGDFKKDALVDSSKYYVITVDALGNGVSSSPSNSPTQHDAAFPEITMRDIVESQHQMLLGIGITHLHAVIGISMGGFQTFQWLLAYPNFLDKAVPIVGSPRPTSYDLMYYGAGIKALKAATKNASAHDDLVRALADYFLLSLRTPSWYARNMKREEAQPSLTGFENSLLAWDSYDVLADLNALYNQDIFRPFGDSEAKAAAAVRAKVFVISATLDHCVNPAAALSFAKALGAKTMILPEDDGHLSTGIEGTRINAAVALFLGEH